MFKRLQKKWNVSTRQFWIIFVVFGLTGTTTAYLTKEINHLLGIGAHTWWVWKVLLKLGMLLIGYQVLLLLYGALFGQWSFFWGYEKKLLQKMRILKKEVPVTKGEIRDTKNAMVNVAIFASGAGTNAQNIIQYFSNHPQIKITLVVCNKPNAGVLKVASLNNIESRIIIREKFYSDGAVDDLKNAGINFIVFAGFLLKAPQILIEEYRNRIINIHPALLPKYGGKGMYGSKVHETVIAARDKESGITIHFVDEHYDNGDIIFQVKCEVNDTDSAENLAQKIHSLEYENFPRVIEECILKKQPGSAISL